MGNIRRIKRQLGGQQFLLADTGIKFNDKKVLLSVGDSQEGVKLGKQFAGFMKILTFRANQVNMGDFYTAHFRITEKITNGLSLEN